MKAKSKNITSPQSSPHEALEALIRKYQITEYQRGISPEVWECYQSQLKQKFASQPVILDSCCGVGESTFHLAKENPNCFVLGVDKSQDRIGRRNHFKKQWPANALIVLGNILDYWLLLEKIQNEITLEKICLFYPNPYPKPSHLKKRWHAQPIGKVLFGLKCSLEMRTNWSVLAEEFAQVAEWYHRQSVQIEQFDPSPCMTPFERKYKESDQALYRVLVAR